MPSIAELSDKVIRLRSRKRHASGAEEVGAAGIAGVTPTGLDDGDGASIQAMLEGIYNLISPTISLNAIIKAPTTSATNVIQPTLATVIPLTIRGFASQSAELLRIEDSASVMRLSVSAAGNLSIAGNLSLTAVTTGAWNASVIGPTYGGTGLSTYTTGDLPYASATNTLARLGIGSAGQFLRVTSGLPAWSSLASGDVTGALGFTPVNRAGDTMIGLLTLSADPTSALHAATKGYVDALVAGVNVKSPVACATTANITLSGEQTIDGVTTSASRVLVKDQSTASQNGIYVSAAGSWTRATDMDGGSEAVGALVFVSGGTANANSQWAVSTPSPITIGTTGITWTLYYSAAAYIGGAGLSLSGLTFNVGTASASRIVVNANDIDLATTAITAGTYTKATYDAYGRATAGASLVDADIPSALTGKTYNALTLTAQAVGFTIAGGTSSRTLTVGGTASVSGTNTGDQTITLTGNVTGSGTGSFATTIAAGVVTLAMQANLAANSLIGNNTGSPATPLALTVAQVKTMLAISSSDVSGLATVAYSGSASDLSAGTLAAARMPALTGDVTSSAGSVATTIANNVVTLAKFQQISTASILGRNTASTGNVEVLSGATVRGILGLATTDSPTFANITLTDAAGPTLALNSATVTNRDLAYHTNGVLRWALIVGNTAESGSNAGSNFSIRAYTDAGATIDDPIQIARVAGGGITITRPTTFSGAISASNLSGTNTGNQTITLTGDVTGSGTGSFAATVSNNAITLAKMATMATASFLGRNTAGTGNVEVLSTATVKTLLNLVGNNTGDQTITLTGDVTGSGTGSFAATIANNSVTLAKMATMATASFLGRNTAATGNVEVLSASTVRSILSISNVENTALSTWSGSTNITTVGTLFAVTTSGRIISNFSSGGSDTLQLTSTSAGTGMIFGGDTRQYRAAAGIWGTDAQFSFQSSNVITGAHTNRGAAFFGTYGGLQIQIDSNEIQAMNGSSPSKLYLNYNGAGSTVVNGSGANCLVIGHDESPIANAMIDIRRSDYNVYAAFGGTASLSSDYPGYIYFSNIACINSGYARNATAEINFNYNGYLNGITQFRDVFIWNGKQQQIAKFQGSDRSAYFNGDITGASSLSINGTTSLYGSLNLRSNSINNINSIVGGGFRTEIGFSTSRGTYASPSDSVNGDISYILFGNAYSGSGYREGSKIQSVIDGTFTSGLTPPQRLEFYTAPANGADTLRMMILGNGNVGIATGAPKSTLDVAGSIGGLYGTRSANSTIGDIVFINITGSSTQTLPAASSCPGRAYFFLRNYTGVGNAYVDRAGSDTIEVNGTTGITSYPMTSNGKFVVLVSNGSNTWISFAHN